MDARRKQLKAASKLNLLSDGILIKKLPATMLDKCRGGGAVPNALQATCQRLQGLGWMDNVATWGRNGLNGGYLNETTSGLVFVKHPNVVLALKSKRVGGAPVTQVVGMVVYGTFNSSRTATVDGQTERWKVSIPGLGANTAEIEAVIRKNTNDGLGVGTALLEHAVADLASKRRGQGPRYTDVVMFSSSDAMIAIAQRYGFTPKAQRYTQGNGNGVNRTATLVDGEFAEDPAESKCYALKLNTQGVQTALDATRNRVMNTNACPPTSGHGLKMWQLCR